MDVLTLALGLGIPGAVAVALFFSPWGPALVSLLANSRLARWLAVVIGVAWALLVGANRMRRYGRREAMADVERANAAARADRERIERQVRELPADDVTEELSRWSR